jgi:hypothetical protein
MTTLNDLRITLETDYLEPVSERTAKTPLLAPMDDSELTFTITDGVLSPDEEAVIGPGAVVEIDYELMQVASFDASIFVVTVLSRAFEGGGPAAAHATGASMRLPTRWPRQSQANALNEAIDNLWKPLYVVEEERITIDTLGYLPLPLDTVEVLRVQYEYDTRWGRDHVIGSSVASSEWLDAEYELFQTHPEDPNFAAVQVVPVISPGALCVIRYGREPGRPDTPADTLDPWEDAWNRIVVLDGAISLLSGVDIDAVTQEYLSQQLRLDRFPVRSGATITQAMIAYREYLVSRRKEKQIAKHRPGVHMMPVTYTG